MFQQITIIGRLGDEPEVKNVKTAAGERAVSNFTVAVNERWTDDAGAKQEHTEWFAVEAWGPLAEAAKHLAKGRLVHIVGQMRTDKWKDDAGNPHSRVKLIAQRIDFLDTPKERA
jgi:single-strand DNA-binding protein